MPKTKIVRKDAYMRPSKATDFCMDAQKGVLSLYSDSFSPPHAKRSKIKTFLKKVYFHEPLDSTLCFIFLKK